MHPNLSNCHLFEHNMNWRFCTIKKSNVPSWKPSTTISFAIRTSRPLSAEWTFISFAWLNQLEFYLTYYYFDLHWNTRFELYWYALKFVMEQALSSGSFFFYFLTFSRLCIQNNEMFFQMIFKNADHPIFVCKQLYCKSQDGQLNLHLTLSPSLWYSEIIVLKSASNFISTLNFAANFTSCFFNSMSSISTFSFVTLWFVCIRTGSQFYFWFLFNAVGKFIRNLLCPGLNWKIPFSGIEYVVFFNISFFSFVYFSISAISPSVIDDNEFKES